MNRVLRSLCWKDQAEKGTATLNFALIRKERFLHLRQAEEAVLDFQIQFFSSYGEAPPYLTIHDHFEKLAKPEEVVLLEEVVTTPFYEGAGLEAEIEEEVELQAAKDLREVCQQTLKIASQGITVKGQQIKGTREAVSYLVTRARSAPSKGDTVPANMKLGQTQLLDLYQAKKNNPQQAYGIMTGYGLVDSSTSGIRKKHFYVHAGFAGHLKTTHALNMTLNAICAGWNEHYFSSEMEANDVKYILVAMHSANQKFAGTNPPLEATKILRSALNPQEESFMKVVLDDLVNNPDHGVLTIIDSGEFTGLGSIIQRTTRDNMDNEVDGVWIDYLTRLPVDPQYRGMSITDARNETIREAKRWAMSFDNGKGLALRTPFQVNREGYKRALEAGGKLDKTALAQYNAIDQEADTISYVWYDEEEQLTCEPKYGLIKSRWGSLPSGGPVRLFIEISSRRMFDMGSGGMTSLAPTQAQGSADEEVVL